MRRRKRASSIINIVSKHIKYTLENLQILFSDITKLYRVQKETEQLKRERGDYFNIFNTIDLRYEEVRLHSAFIAELLNPRGSHGCSSLFLSSFLRIIGVDDDYINPKYCSLDIKERVIGAVTATEGGRIDIIIEDGKHAVIIENKINAGDQTNQMLRYHNYGHKEFPKGFELIYLTLDGHEPAKCSLGTGDYDYRVISYEEEIIEWLNKCYEIAKDNTLVQSVVAQYRELVKQITHTGMDAKYKEQLKKLALAPENVLAVGELLKIQGEWFESLLKEYIWGPLENFATSKGLKFDIDCSYGASGAWIYKPEWEYYALFIRTGRRGKWGKMYVGVSWYEEPNRNNKIFKKDYTQLNCLDCEPCDGWPYGYEYLRPDIQDWTYNITNRIVQGDVFRYIKIKFEEMLEEIEKRRLPMY